MTEYRKGHEYVVCTECGSHIMLDADFVEFVESVGSMPNFEFSCDWDECQETFCADVEGQG